MCEFGAAAQDEERGLLVGRLGPPIASYGRLCGYYYQQTGRSAIGTSYAYETQDRGHNEWGVYVDLRKLTGKILDATCRE